MARGSDAVGKAALYQNSANCWKSHPVTYEIDTPASYPQRMSSGFYCRLPGHRRFPPVGDLEVQIPNRNRWPVPSTVHVECPRIGDSPEIPLKLSPCGGVRRSW